jgi:hypothetical protein
VCGGGLATVFAALRAIGVFGTGEDLAEFGLLDDEAEAAAARTGRREAGGAFSSNFVLVLLVCSVLSCSDASLAFSVIL